MDNNNVLSLDSITLKYRDKIAIKDLSLTLTDGVYGLLGPNGSGKSFHYFPFYGLIIS
ncbi:MAG: hypothetical protein K6G26_05590 [Lachnospiraceae bacterium]|nr:hypothetical protein [Lachnospiraceae bacterium]